MELSFFLHSNIRRRIVWIVYSRSEVRNVWLDIILKCKPLLYTLQMLIADFAWLLIAAHESCLVVVEGSLSNCIVRESMIRHSSFDLSDKILAFAMHQARIWPFLFPTSTLAILELFLNLSKHIYLRILVVIILIKQNTVLWEKISFLPQSPSSTLAYHPFAYSLLQEGNSRFPATCHAPANLGIVW